MEKTLFKDTARKSNNQLLAKEDFHPHKKLVNEFNDTETNIVLLIIFFVIVILFLIPIAEIFS
ncbi:MAG: hypothetical protein WC635_17095 [Bacteriovorax sp.]|jgi:hypothetical protein